MRIRKELYGCIACLLLTAGPALAEQPPTDIVRNVYRGPNDLLTAGLGVAGLQSATAPSVSATPTDEELRTLAIWSNYRALVDTSTAGGFGVLYGPTIAPTKAEPATGKVYGIEYLAYARGRQNVTMMVQIPDGFDPAKACIVTAPSSGSRGVYGAIGTAGEWGLKNGCAVAYTDKGTGTGAHDLHDDTVSLLRGRRVPADEAGRRSNFTAPISDRERTEFDAAFPYRFAWKHAHSRTNPEASWDEDVLQALDFAFWVLNREKGPRKYGPGNTIVIASSVSNGGGASLRAAEAAPRGLIDAVVVSEPNVNPRYSSRFVIKQGNGPALIRHSRPLFDYVTRVNLLQTCANLAASNASAPFNPVATASSVPFAENRCRSLAEAGVLEGTEPAGWPDEAQRLINAYGILPAQNIAAPAYSGFYVQQAVAVTYANAYARASVKDDLCAFSFAAVASGVPAPLPDASEAILFGVGNGIPPTGGVQVINDANPAPVGPLLDQISTSPTFGRADLNLDGALCLRSLDRGDEFTKGRRAPLKDRLRVWAGVRQILADGKLGGIPTVIVHGRSDALVQPNHSSRAYYALSLLADGRRSRIRYWEVTNAQHLDAFNALPGLSSSFVPLHYYFMKAMDLVYGSLTDRSAPALPPSQVIRTTPRAGGAPITTANVPLPTAAPGGDAITFDGRVLSIPD
ncbi:MAG: 3-hydroxybutyrate oligomer hydrolase family protein [Geminicoccaceae bacterium]